MKIVKNNKEKKDRVKKKHVAKPKKAHVLIVAQEIKFARLLSGNEKKTRDRVLKTLKKWLLNCFQKGYEFKEDDFTRVWKGLFYAVWMSDKPLIQEELCDNIAAILDVFPMEQIHNAVLMIKAGFKVLATEWFGIDHHRMDKFLMLVRRYLRGSLRCLLRCEWSLDSCKMYSDMLSASDGIFALKTPHYARNATSMLLHVIDCYLEELSKVSSGDIPGESLCELLRPFVQCVCAGASAGSSAALGAAARRLLTALVRQSDAGLRYLHKTRAWQRMGCPGSGPDALELVSDDEADDDGVKENGDAGSDGEHETSVEEEEAEEGPRALDPRAGRVHVELAPLRAPAAQLASMLRPLLATAASKAHKRAKLCLQRFEQLARDEYPLRITAAVEEGAGEGEGEGEGARMSTRGAAQSLQALEKNLLSNSDELALRGLSRKHRKRLLAKSRAGLSIVDDIDKIKQAKNTSTVGDWEVEPAEPDAKKPKKEDKSKSEDTSNKENQDKNKKNKKQKQSDKQNNKRKHDKVTVNGGVKKEKVDKKVKKSKVIVTEVVNESKNKLVKAIAKEDSELILNVSTKPVIKQKPVQTVAKIQETEVTKQIKTQNPSVLVNKVKKFQKQTQPKKEAPEKVAFDSPKRVKFVLKNNSMQGPVDYYKSVRQSPSIPFDSSKKPNKTNLKPSTPSPINPFFKKKLRMRK